MTTIPCFIAEPVEKPIKTTQSLPQLRPHLRRRVPRRLLRTGQERPQLLREQRLRQQPLRRRHLRHRPPRLRLRAVRQPPHQTVPINQRGPIQRRLRPPIQRNLQTQPPASHPTRAPSRGSDPDQPISDPNRPILRRGKPDPNAHHEPYVNFDDPVQAAAASKDAGKEAAAAQTAAAASVKTVAAISDAAGPDPRPYTYDLKPAEEAIYRNKMLELAGQQLQSKSQQAAQNASTAASKSANGAKSSTGAASARNKAPLAKITKPALEDINLRIFDLSNSNEPVLVLSARTPVPPATASGAQVPREITLIARTNLEGELQKLFFAQTDSRHLDLSPRMELIDAVDADGDGRGELLFRRTFDAGSAYAIYRVTADGLWPLWEPTP
jgi:hypothetical protein